MSDIITITEADLARLQPWEFEEVWRAVGYVFRRRAEASKTLPAVPPAIEPAPVPLAPVEAPPVVPPGCAPGEKEGADYSTEIPDAGQPGDAVEECRSDTNVIGSDFPASDDAPKSEPGEFACVDCGQAFARAQALAAHRSIRHGVKGQDVHANRPRATTDPACPECGKVCKPTGIGTHRRIAHGSGQAMATCEDCGITMQAAAIGQHRRFRHAEPKKPPPPRTEPRTCEICGYQAPGPSTLEAHQRTCRVKAPEAAVVETFVLLEPPAEPAPAAHVHRYKLGSPAGDSVEGLCGCGHRKLHPAEPQRRHLAQREALAKSQVPAVRETRAPGPSRVLVQRLSAGGEAS